MEESSQIAWKPVPLKYFSPLKVVPLIEVLLYSITIFYDNRNLILFRRKLVNSIARDRIVLTPRSARKFLFF
jgi:hypothetical protein